MIKEICDNTVLTDPERCPNSNDTIEIGSVEYFFAAMFAAGIESVNTSLIWLISANNSFLVGLCFIMNNCLLKIIYININVRIDQKVSENVNYFKKNAAFVITIRAATDTD